MIPQDTLYAALPEVIVLCTACLALLGDLFLKQKWKDIAYGIALVGLVCAAIFSGLLFDHYPIVLFHGLFISDDSAHLMKLFIYLTVFLGYIYSHHYIEERQMPLGDYYVLGLFSTLGMMILVSAHSLLTIYLGLELLSLPLYVMTAIRRIDSNASEAAMKYFVMGAIASGMMLYGISLLYGCTGKLDLLDITNAIAANWQDQSSLLSFALVFILVGICFKLAAVPFHMWAPDVYQGAPTSVTLFISTAPKIAALGMALRLLTLGLADISAQWQSILIAVSLLSTGIGNILALVQTEIKRLFAYSAIAHAGYTLFGIAAVSAEGYSSALYYILIYAVMTLGVFGFITLLSRQGVEIEKIDDLKGLNSRNPWLAAMIMIVLFSLAGVPPTAGFFAKLLVLKALVDSHLTWLAVIGLLFAVVGAYYYIRIVKVMYFDEATDAKPVTVPMASQILFSVNCLALLYWGILPSGLITACIGAFSR